MRLDQFIAHCTPLSRKEAKRAIARGRVTIRGLPCRDAGEKITEDCPVCLDDEGLHRPGERYLMLNKPAGVVSATTDADHPTALDLLPPELIRDLHIAGRLDLDTTGLLLLTTDGQWSHRITSPRTDCPKVYQVTLDTSLSDEAERQLTRGVQLKSEDRMTRPADVRRLGNRIIELTISEGRYHQVKRMLAAVSNHVQALHRIQVGNIRLDPDLKPGEFRPLTPEEVASVG
jgi:16S rRNA pseudouridine516 synthase